MAALTFNPKYQPLFRPTTRYVIMTGGRASGKSVALAASQLCATYADPFNILYSRYTMTSAEVSIIPEFTDKMDQLGCRGAFKVRRSDVVNVKTGSRILFRGLKESSKNQIARLKSLARIKTWVLDEAQELDDETTFDTIDDSIRDKDAKNTVILVLNPSDVSHWIYQRFFVKPGVPADFNGVRGDVTYIHTTYLDNALNLSPSFLSKVRAIRRANPDKYAHEYLGAWLVRREGLIYRNWKRIRPDEYPETLPHWYGVDWGYTDWPNAIVRMCYDPAAAVLYLWEVQTSGRLTRDAAKAIIHDGTALVHHIEDDGPVNYTPAQLEAYCDPARPENIAELRQIYDISAMKAVNRDKAGRIHYLQGFSVRYVGEHIGREVAAYSWKPDPHNKGLFLDVPQDGNDHYCDAISYGATRLRQMGVNGDADL